uniref:Si:dkey-245n4.2 n=1 Tax=Neogobius melanostomus TaxID=47308 RepID=A0A8C6UU55_9GOBI
MSESFLEWRWLRENHALQSQYTTECLTAPTEQYEGVQLLPCVFTEQTSEEGDDMMIRQSWSCSKKGHLTLREKGLHLSAIQESSLVFVSREHKQGSRWRALDNQTLCEERQSKHLQEQHSQYPGKLVEAVDEQSQPYEGLKNSEATETYPFKNVSLPSVNTKSAVDPTMIFFNMDYGMGWKITMLVLSSLALVLGTIILILNVYSNRQKKVVCVLKSYSPRQEMRVPGSPVPSERAPLTEHAMRLPQSTPTLQRGEILIEWKDGTVTPLYEA